MPNEETAVGRLLAVLARGERLAHDCARRQAQAAGPARAARFFAAQAAQERVHAAAFDAALALVSRSARRESPADAPFDRLRNRLERDLAHGELLASVVGLQVMFEGLGAVALERLNLARLPHGERFAPLRRALAREEAAHQAFGARFVESALARGAIAPERVRAATAEYRHLGEAVLDGCAALLADLRVARPALDAAFRQSLPAWAAA